MQLVITEKTMLKLIHYGIKLDLAPCMGDY